GVGGRVVEPGAGGEDQVGAAGGAVGLVGAVAAGRAEVQRPLQLADALAEGGGDDRDPGGHGERGELPGRLGGLHAVAGHDQRPPGVPQQLQDRGDLGGGGGAGAGGGGRPSRHWPGSGTSSAEVSTNTSSGTSRCTGPGRPASMAANAWRSISGSWSARVAWKLRLT